MTRKVLSVATFEPGGLCSLPSLSGTGHGCGMGRSRKEPSWTEGDWKVKWHCVSLHMVAAPGASGMEGSTDSRNYMLGLLLIVLNCALLEISSLPVHAELLVWSCPVLMTIISKHKSFQKKKQSVKVGWDVAPLLAQHQALHSRPWAHQSRDGLWKMEPRVLKLMELGVLQQRRKSHQDWFMPASGALPVTAEDLGRGGIVEVSTHPEKRHQRSTTAPLWSGKRAVQESKSECKLTLPQGKHDAKG